MRPEVAAALRRLEECCEVECWLYPGVDVVGSPTTDLLRLREEIERLECEPDELEEGFAATIHAWANENTALKAEIVLLASVVERLRAQIEALKPLAAPVWPEPER